MLTVAGGTLTIMVLDLLVPRFWNGYERFKYEVLFILGLVLIVVIMLPYIKRKVSTPDIIHDDLEKLS